jgi:D-glycero-D-manno-heptose 1,7-bisphosphate phosphatase
MRAVFLDKDGTLVEDVPFNVDPERIRLAVRVGPALRLLTSLGYQLFVVSNQSGVARGMFEESALGPVWSRLNELLRQEGVSVREIACCMHHPEGVVQRYAIACQCRKPEPGMLLELAREHDIDLHASWMIGDILDDVEAGHKAGCRSVLIDNGNETLWGITPTRVPELVATDLYHAAEAIRTCRDACFSPPPGRPSPGPMA